MTLDTVLSERREAGGCHGVRAAVRIVAVSAERKREEAKLSEYLGIGGLSDEEAQRVAEEAVREARRELGRGRVSEGPAPSPEEVRRILSSRDRGRGR